VGLASLEVDFLPSADQPFGLQAFRLSALTDDPDPLADTCGAQAAGCVERVPFPDEVSLPSVLAQLANELSR
jgi:hypothetical protein